MPNAAARFLVGTFLLFVSSAPPALAQPLAANGRDGATPPVVTVTQTELAITGVTPKGSVVIFGVGRAATGTVATAVHTTKMWLADEDGDGKVTFKPAYAIPLRSVWVVLDFDTGAYAVTGRSDYKVKTRSVPPNALRSDDAGVAYIDDERARLALLLLKPGKGAWYQYGAFGAQGDVDKNDNRKLTLAFEAGASFVAGNKEKAPRHVSKGDVIVAIDPARLDVFALTVEK
jgi:hypothetical protein